MRNAARAFIEKTASEQQWTGPVYEFGARHVNGAKASTGENLADLRRFFPNSDYVGCDIVRGRGVDEVRDVYATKLPDKTAGVVICAELFEHLTDPFAATAEMGRVLRSDGLLIVTTLFRFPIHEWPGDYWRFTPDGLGHILGAVGTAHIEHDMLDGNQVGVYGWCRIR